MQNLKYTQLKDLSIIEVTGIEAKKFLQGQLTCDINDLQSPGDWSFGAHLNTKGRIRSLFIVINAAIFAASKDDLNQDCFYCLVLSELAEYSLSELKKYALFSKVNINLLSQDEKFIYGLMLNNSEAKNLVDLSKENQIIIDYLENPNAKILISNSKLENIKDINKLNNLENTELNAWHQIEIQANIPAIYPETIEKFLPHNLELHKLSKTISFNKGCYLGQEIVSRMQYKTTIKKSLKLLTLNNQNSALDILDFMPGDNIYNSANHALVGQIVRCNYINNSFYLLCVLDNDLHETQNNLYIINKNTKKTPIIIH